MKERIEIMANRMLDNYLTFLPIEDAIFLNIVKIKTEMNYVVNYEELENDYHSDKNKLFNEAKVFFGDDFYEIKSSEDDFEVSICSAPTYIELLKWLRDN